MKRSVKFTCYKYFFSNPGTWSTLFLFYPDDIWDEDKLTIGEAVAKYPPDEWEWVHMATAA